MKTFTFILFCLVFSLVSCNPCECNEKPVKSQNPLLAGDGEFFLFRAIDAEGNEITTAFAEPSTQNTYTVLCKEYYEMCEIFVATATDTVLLKSYRRPTTSGITYPVGDER